MGANVSRPSGDAAINEKLLERLQALHVKDERSTSEKDGYVLVGGDARMYLDVMRVSRRSDLHSTTVHPWCTLSTRRIRSDHRSMGEGTHGRPQSRL
jgi:bleomycin hydrolase